MTVMTHVKQYSNWNGSLPLIMDKDWAPSRNSINAPIRPNPARTPAPGKSWNTGWPRAPGAPFTCSANKPSSPCSASSLRLRSGPCGKAALGFRRFSLRGLSKVRTEWTLVTLAYNLKRLFHLGADLAAA